MAPFALVAAISPAGSATTVNSPTRWSATPATRMGLPTRGESATRNSGYGSARGVRSSVAGTVGSFRRRERAAASRALRTHSS